MAYEIIEQYLNNILRTQLDIFGTNKSFAEHIINTAREQILSCIFHWNDEVFRKTLLIIGSEESAFYKPYALDDIRSFVVVTIRNSEIECLQSENFSMAGLLRKIDDSDVRTITSSAVKYFSNVDFVALQKDIEAPAVDKYGSLSQKYPVSWNALTNLANSKKQVGDYGSTPVLIKPSLEILPTIKETKTIGRSSNASSISVALVSDGFSFSIDPQLKSMLEYCVKNEQPFLVDTFKGLTRNIEKLLLVMEYLLCRNTEFVTSNYYLLNGHTERRMKLLRAGRSYDAGFKNWKQTAGLGARHKAVLSAVTKP